MAGGSGAPTPPPVPDKEQASIPIYRPQHDRLSAFAKLIMVVQNKLGMSPHAPRVGENAGQYYKIDRTQIQSKSDTRPDSQPLPEPSNS